MHTVQYHPGRLGKHQCLFQRKLWQTIIMCLNNRSMLQCFMSASTGWSRFWAYIDINIHNLYICVCVRLSLSIYIVCNVECYYSIIWIYMILIDIIWTCAITSALVGHCKIHSQLLTEYISDSARRCDSLWISFNRVDLGNSPHIFMTRNTSDMFNRFGDGVLRLWILWGKTYFWGLREMGPSSKYHIISYYIYI